MGKEYFAGDEPRRINSAHLAVSQNIIPSTTPVFSPSIKMKPRLKSTHLLSFPHRSLHNSHPHPPPPPLSAPTPPILPCNLCIDRTTPLANTIPLHAQHLVLSTGCADWPSRIENGDSNPSEMARGLKELLGRRGEYFDVKPPPFSLSLGLKVKTSSDRWNHADAHAK